MVSLNTWDDTALHIGIARSFSENDNFPPMVEIPTRANSIVPGLPAIRSRRGPRRRGSAKLCADKGYDFDHLRREESG